MSISVTINGISYTIPEVSEKAWGADCTSWIAAASSGLLQKEGGSFTLTADVDFGANKGLLSKYFTSRTTNAASAGVVRLANDEILSWRNFANSADINMKIGADDKLYIGSNEILDSGNTVTATNKTFTSPVLNDTVTGTGVLDEDDLASDSATQIATQQSIKAYVDNKTTTAAIRVRLYDNTLTTLPTGDPVTIDDVQIEDGDKVLFSNLSSGNNRVYDAAVTGTEVTGWTALAIFLNESLDPSVGESLRILEGTVGALKTYIYDDSDFVDNSSTIDHTLIENIGTNTHSQIDTAVTASTNHIASDGKDHSDVVLNNTHRASDGKNHSDVVLNNTHRASDGKNHSDVVLNNTHRTGDGSDHANVALNDTHRGSDGKDHSDVVLNNTHRSSDGKNHSDVVLNNAHRVVVAGNPHEVTKAEVGLGNCDNTSDAAKPVSDDTQTALDLKVALAGAETITGIKTFDEELIMKQNADPGAAAANHNKLYFKDDDKLYMQSETLGEKVIGGGLIPVEIDHTYATDLAAGNHYMVDMSSAPADVVLNLEPGALESVIAISVFGTSDQTAYDTTPYYVKLTPDGVETIWSDEKALTPAVLGDNASTTVLTWDSTYDWVSDTSDLFCPNDLSGNWNIGGTLTVEDVADGTGITLENPDSDPRVRTLIGGADYGLTNYYTNGNTVGASIRANGTSFILGSLGVGKSPNASDSNALAIGLGAGASGDADTIKVFAKDTSNSTATLALRLEQSVEAIGTFTPSHKIKIHINGDDYWLQLDQV